MPIFGHQHHFSTRRRTDHPEMAKKHLKVKAEAKRLKAEMGKVREDQLCLREEQTKLITRCGEIERQCNELQQEAEMMAEQSAMTGIKLSLMLGILKAREGGDLTHKDEEEMQWRSWEQNFGDFIYGI